MLTKAEIMRRFTQSIQCSQIVAGEMAGALGYDRERVMRIAAPFGGGMFCGEICGAAAGGLMVIGMRYGHGEAGGAEPLARCAANTAAFLKRFAEEHGGLRCKDLLGYDLAEPGGLEKAFASGRVEAVCPGYVISALDILKELLGPALIKPDF